MSRIPVLLRSLVLVLAVCLGAVGCAQEEPLSSMTGSRAFPATISAANGTVVVPKRPERIVSLSPTATEMLFSIGAGDQVIAVDDQSNYPPDAPKTDLSGFQPNAEAVAQRDPDLVVLSDDINEIVKSLVALDIPTLHNPAAADLGDIYEQLDQLGKATGHQVEARRLASGMRDEIEGLVDKAATRGLTYYHELDDKLFTVTSKTFIGQVYASFGLRNIADAAPGAETLYPQLSAEYIINADPDVIFLADTKCCRESQQSVARRPGWDNLTAVKRRAVVELSDDVASRWGPRIVEFYKAVADQLTRLES